MTYTTEEKKRIDAVLLAFQDYISQHHYFDILYSEKRGYIHLTLERDFIDATEIKDPTHLFHMLLIDVINDVQDLFLCGEHIDGALFPEEKEEIRRRMQPFFNRLPRPLQITYPKRMEYELENYND